MDSTTNSKIYNINNIKSKHILKKIFENINKRIKLLIIKENNKLQKKLNIDLNDYKDNYKVWSSIYIEIKPSNTYGKFITIWKKDENAIERENYYHIYFNDNKQEIKKKYYLNKNDKVKKINIVNL